VAWLLALAPASVAGGLTVYLAGDKLLEIVEFYVDIRGSSLQALAPNPGIGVPLTLFGGAGMVLACGAGAITSGGVNAIPIRVCS
jgi:hypothetical protein